MAKRQYKLKSGGLHEKFNNSRKKIQFFGGGFGNGKTAAAVVLKALKIARDYPGSNILLARSTYPKLNDTLRKEFIKWCPSKWIKSFPKSQNATNTCTLNNGSMINFRYVEQQGKGNESSTSNLLSATYDAIIVDQIEDPEIGHKDFLDLLGRLRGNTPYVGDDPTMPKTGPRWFIITSNPTRNWVFRKVINPVHQYQQFGKISDDLLCRRWTHKMFLKGLCTKEQIDQPILDEEGKPTLIIDIFEGSTYENEDNLGADFIQTLESAYRGQMKERFLMGKWGAFEGLVYPDHEESIHAIPRDKMIQYLLQLGSRNIKLKLLEGYDHGLAAPACYLLALVDHLSIVHILDGFHTAELTPQQIINNVHNIRRRRIGYSNFADRIWADPSVFRRGSGDKKIVGKKVSDILADDGNGISLRRANNEILNGITKVQGYFSIDEHKRNPYTDVLGSPTIFYAEELEFITEEASDYYWQKNSDEQYIDKPVDKNDHAMDTLKYLLSNQPPIAEIIKSYETLAPYLNTWSESASIETQRNIRHG